MNRSHNWRKGWFGAGGGVLALCLFAGSLRAILPPAGAQDEPPAGIDKEEIARLEAVSRAFRNAARIARPGVVHIRATGKLDTKDLQELEQNVREQLGDRFDEKQFREFLRRHQDDMVASGSGILIDTQGHVLTNNHVVNGRDHIRVQLFDDREYEATTVGLDPKTDLAVLKISASNLQPLKFADSDKLDVGDWVIAVGAPFGLSQTVTHGIVSAKGRSRVGGINIMYQDFIQTDAAINPGNSGGPLLNLRGEVVGINTAIATNGDSYNAGIAFTIPSNMAVRIANDLKEGGEVVRGWLGISMGDLKTDDREIFGVKEGQGVLVDSLIKDGPAAQAGLQLEDVILTLNDVAIGSPPQLMNTIAGLRPGDAVRLHIVRDRQQQNVEMKLGRQPKNLEAVARDPDRNLRSRELPMLNLLVRSLYSEEARLRGYAAADRGVLVRGHVGDVVAPIKPGELIVSCNGQLIESVDALQHALKGGGKKVKLQVVNQEGERRVIEVEAK